MSFVQGLYKKNAIQSGGFKPIVADGKELGLIAICQKKGSLEISRRVISSIFASMEHNINTEVIIFVRKNPVLGGGEYLFLENLFDNSILVSDSNVVITGGEIISVFSITKDTPQRVNFNHDIKDFIDILLGGTSNLTEQDIISVSALTVKANTGVFASIEYLKI